MLWQESVMSSMDQMQMIGPNASLAQFTELQTVENENAPSMIVWDKSMMQQGKPQVLLNVPSEQMLVTNEGVPVQITTHDLTALNQAAINEKYKLRSPSKATQEEIDLTKRYLYANENIKQQKIFSQSVIKNKRTPTNSGAKSKGLPHSFAISSIPIN